MIDPIRYRFQFNLERFLLRGALYRLLFIAALIGLISIIAGGTARLLSHDFATSGEAVWWAFLRLTDPGYLGDDKGLGLRTISTVVTVLGYVIFMGSLIAILTQWLNSTINKLEAGLTPISIKGHIIILGWTNRTPAIVRELVLSETRMKRFLEKVGVRKLRIAILSEAISHEQHHELAGSLGKDWDERQVIFRSGSPLRNEHLIRVNYLKAAAIILPGQDFSLGGSDSADMHMIKILMAIANHARHAGVPLPYMVAEVFDTRKISVAKSAYPGNVETVPSDMTISLLIAQNIRHPWLSHIYSELLSHAQGNEIRIRHLDQFENQTFERLIPIFPKAIPMGILRLKNGQFMPLLNPAPGLKLEKSDRLVLMACSHKDADPDPSLQPADFPRGPHRENDSQQIITRRVLLLGWNDMIPALINELDNYQSEVFEVDIFSSLSSEKRQERLNRFAIDPARVKLRLLDGDYTVPSDLTKIAPADYDNIVILGCDWLPTPEEADARTILGFMLIRELLQRGEKDSPRLLLELLDPENQFLFSRSPEEVITSPLILSHILAHVALMPSLNIIFQELFSSGGAEIYLRSCSQYGLASEEVSFRDIQERVSQHGELALGVRIQANELLKGGIELNPAKDKRWLLTREDEIVVLTTYT
jgi:hypothetical protein